MLYLDGGEDLIHGGRAAGAAYAKDYTEHRYHAPGDEYDPDWDLRGVVQDLQVLYGIGERIAGSDVWPQWRETSEFRAAGDALTAQRQ